MELLSIGSVVKLKKGTQKLMITSRVPLTNESGVIGYYDYGACLFPNGQINQESIFFNNEDIDELFFKGYVDEAEELYRKKYETEITKVQYPRLKVKI
ncbi:MAG: DUF4176 domain-containing protein [Hespellia sp.]|nr:DUF4176 domain-containing protein [Hespellia sp.]